MVDIEENTTPYTYTPLTEGQIRLFALSPGEEHDQIRGCFKVVSLKRPPPYRAISYAWGDAVLSRKVIVDERQLNITLSLEGALRRLRSKSDEVVLWADAVCINQADLDEKASQVMTMFSIFSKSESVAVWLGPMTSDDADAFWTVRIFDRMLRELPDDHVEGRPEAALAFFDQAHTGPANRSPPRCRCCGNGQQRSYNGMESIRIGMDAVAQLISRPYFSRLWIVQELVAGTRLMRTSYRQRGPRSHYPIDMTTRLYCGSHHIAFSSLINAIRGYNRLPAFALRRPWSSAADNVLNLGRLVRMFNMSRLSGMPSLLQVMDAVKDMACTDPRDRVFALRAMTGIDGIASLKPAYDIPPNVLWQRMATHLLTTSSATKFPSPAVVLAMAAVCRDNSLPRTTRSLPLWVPDFERLSDHTGLKQLSYDDIFYQFSSGGSQRFEAVCNSTSTEILQVRTTKVFEITFEITLTWVVSSNGWYRFSYRGVDVVTAFSTPKGKTDVFRTDEMISLRDLETRFSKINATSPQPYSLESLLVLQDLKMINFRSDYHASDARAGKVWISDLGMDCTRILACTAHGRGCWVPRSSQVGDIICVLQGAPCPFVLRPSPAGRYAIVGDAYVHGIMNGEAWTDDAGPVEDIMLV
ncbi:hypothetical protein LTR95_006278 [Oleoguttula sp. CCFEE 5521]